MTLRMIQGCHHDDVIFKCMLKPFTFHGWTIYILYLGLCFGCNQLE